MSQPTPATNSHDAVVVRAGQAETIRHPPTTVRPLADASAIGIGGALTTIRVAPPEGGDGARPHHHAGAAELFSLRRRQAQGEKETR